MSAEGLAEPQPQRRRTVRDDSFELRMETPVAAVITPADHERISKICLDRLRDDHIRDIPPIAARSLTTRRARLDSFQSVGEIHFI